MSHEYITRRQEYISRRRERISRRRECIMRRREYISRRREGITSYVCQTTVPGFTIPFFGTTMMPLRM